MTNPTPSDELNPLLAMLTYPPSHTRWCPFVYYGYDGMSKKTSDELYAQCKCKGANR